MTRGRRGGLETYLFFGKQVMVTVPISVWRFLQAEKGDYLKWCITPYGEIKVELVKNESESSI